MATTTSTPPQSIAATSAGRGPFKFLEYYGDSPEDRRRFGGRERETREIVAGITSSRTFVLYARSGLGKTSVLLAGVFPALRARGYRPVYVRTLISPVGDLCRALATEGGGGATGDLRELARQATLRNPVIIVLDQFEEFFIRFREAPAVRLSFIEAVTGLVNDEALDLSFVFSLREDYLADLDDFRERALGMFDAELRLRPLTSFGVRQAISLALTDAGVPYEDLVLSKLVDQLEDFDNDPPVLQIIGSELYKAAVQRSPCGSARIAARDLDAIGGLEGIFRRYLDGLAQAIPTTLHLLARIVLDTMITRDGTKQAATLEHLLAARFSATASELTEVLSYLVGQRLLRCEVREDTAWYELTHERLVPLVRSWLDLDREFFEFRQARNFVHNNSEGELWRNNPEALLNAGVLADLVDPYRERFRFDRAETEFVLRSAVFRQASGVSFWVGRFGNRESVELLSTAMRAASPLERLTAAKAAGEALDSDGLLSETCFELALHDPEEKVRRAAGVSLARFMREPERVALRSALRRRETRRQARELLASLHLGGHRLRGFSWLLRRRASDMAEARSWREHDELIKQSSRTGAVNGSLAGMAWALSVGAILSVLRTSIPSTDVATLAEWLRQLGLTIAVTFLCGAILGAILGALAARAAAKSVTLEKESKWSFALLRDFALWLAAIVCGLGVGVLVLLLQDRPGPWIFSTVLIITGFWCLFATIALTCVVGLVDWCSTLLRPTASPQATWIWSLLLSAGLPLLLPWALIMTALAESRGNVVPLQILSGLIGGTDSFTSVVGLSAEAASLATAVLSFAVSRTRLSPPFRPRTRPPWRRLLSQAFALAPMLVLCAWFASQYGLDSIPLFAPTLRYDPKDGLSFSRRVGPAILDTRYFRIENKSPRTQVIDRHVDRGSILVRLGTATTNETILLPRGVHLGSVSLPIVATNEIDTSVRIDLKPRIIYFQPSGHPIMIDSKHGTLRRVILHRDTSSEWSARLTAVPPPGVDSLLLTVWGYDLERLPLENASISVKERLPLEYDPIFGKWREIRLRPSYLLQGLLGSRANPGFVEDRFLTEPFGSHSMAAVSSFEPQWEVRADKKGAWAVDLVVEEPFGARSAFNPSVKVELLVQLSTPDSVIGE